MVRDLGKVVFVVIGRNEGERLRSCLSSVLALSKAVVYADSASSDGSVALARSLDVKVVEIASAPMNAARGRSEGLAAARSAFGEAQFVQFIDGDCVLNPDWPKAAAAFLSGNPRVAAVCGRRREADPESSFYNRLVDFEWNTPVGQIAACGGDSMMRIAALEEAGGFDVTLMASEEPELCSRLARCGWEIWRLDREMTEHDAAIHTFAQWWRRTVRSGYGYAQVWRKNGWPSRGGAAGQLKSAILWIAAFPMLVCMFALALDEPELTATIPVAYLLQLLRIRRRYGGSLRFSLRAAALVMIAKVAELTGAAEYLVSSGPSTPIAYKRPSL